MMPVDRVHNASLRPNVVWQQVSAVHRRGSETRVWGGYRRVAVPPEQGKIVDEVIRLNAFFAHPGNLLVAMVCDSNPETRALGWRGIESQS